MLAFSTSRRRLATSCEVGQHDLLGPLVDVGAGLGPASTCLSSGLLGRRRAAPWPRPRRPWSPSWHWSMNSLRLWPRAAERPVLEPPLAEGDERVVAGQHVDAVEHERHVVEVEVLDLLPAELEELLGDHVEVGDRDRVDLGRLSAASLLLRADPSPSLDPCPSRTRRRVCPGPGRRACRPCRWGSAGRLGLRPPMPHERPGGWPRSRRRVPPSVAGAQQRRELGVRAPLRAEQCPGRCATTSWRPEVTMSFGLKASVAPLPAADEDDLGGQVGPLLERVVGVPDDLGRRPVDARADRATAAGRPSVRGAGRRRTARPATAWAPRGRSAGSRSGAGRGTAASGRPCLTYAVRLSICFCVSDDGWATSSTSRSVGTRLVGRDRARRRTASSAR